MFDGRGHIMMRAGRVLSTPHPGPRHDAPSRVGRSHAMTAQNHTPPIKLCEVCGSPIKGKPSHVARSRCCSLACRTVLQSGSGNPNWRGGLVEVVCAECGRKVVKIPAQAKAFRYCSKQCLARAQSVIFRGKNSPRWKGGSHESQRRYRAKHAKPRQVVLRPVVEPAPSRPKRERFCKRCGLPGVKKGLSYHSECSPRLVRKAIIFECVDCGLAKRIFPMPGHVQLRCLACELKNRRGSQNSNWKGGITPINQKIRASERYKAWRKSVFERDGYTCVWCGQCGGTLHADHIKPFSTHKTLRFELSNGRTLCVDCHKMTDTFLCKAKRKRRRFRQGTFTFS
jgi:5-methylcytosine-specific restriction endonuclease McrA